jgi:hypothetical protein
VQAIERTLISNNWVTLIFVFLFVCIVLLKALNGEKLKAYFFAFFNKSFIISEIEERPSSINWFSVLFTLFSITSNTLFICFLAQKYLEIEPFNLQWFWTLFIFSFFYLIVKWLVEQSITLLFSIGNEVKFFLTSKNTYLLALSLWIFLPLVFLFYSDFNQTVLISIISFFFFFRVVLVLRNNKKLILNKLFYFILYICALEIAPLFILYKSIF